MIKHVIFDLGQVLIGFKPLEFLLSYQISPQQCKAIARECFETDLWNEVDRGTYFYKDAAALLCTKFPDIAHILSPVFTKDIYKIFTELEKGSALLRWCAQQGYDCYYLSNFGSEGFHYVNQKFDFFKVFKGGTASYEIHSIKPEPEIYTHFLKTYALNPEECVFIDDNPKNIEAASILGFHGIVCDGYEHVYQSLETLTGRKIRVKEN